MSQLKPERMDSQTVAVGIKPPLVDNIINMRSPPAVTSAILLSSNACSHSLYTHRISLSLCHHYQSPRTFLLTCNRTKFFPQLPKGLIITVTFSSTMHFHLRGTQFFNKSSPQTSRVYKYHHWNQQLKSRNSSSAGLLFIHVFCPNK